MALWDRARKECQSFQGLKSKLFSLFKYWAAIKTEHILECQNGSPRAAINPHRQSIYNHSMLTAVSVLETLNCVFTGILIYDHLHRK